MIQHLRQANAIFMQSLRSGYHPFGAILIVPDFMIKSCLNLELRSRFVMGLKTIALSSWFSDQDQRSQCQ
jgi:hypothetical protein